MSSDLEVKQGLRRLSGPVDTRGAWESIEARAEKIDVSRMGGHRLRIAALICAAVVLAAGVTVGMLVGIHHLERQDMLVINDDTNMAAQPGNVQVGTWMRLPLAYDGTQVSCLAIDPTNSAILYAGTPWGLFKSIDAAESWEKISAVTALDRISVDPASPLTIVAVSAGVDPRLYTSLDGGATWREVGTEIPGDDPSLQLGGAFFDTSSQPSTVYLAPFFTTDSQPSTVGMSADYYGCWRSIDQGETWTKLSADEANEMAGRLTNAPATWVGMDFVLTDPLDPTVFYKPTILGVEKSVDQGATWQYVNRGLACSEAQGLVVDPSSPGILYATTPMGIFKSTDSGETWTKILGGGAGAFAEGMGWWNSGSLVVAPSMPPRIYARTSLGLFRSDNGGVEWASLPGEGLPSTVPEQDGIDPDGVDDPVVLVAANDPDVVFIRSTQGMYRSGDGGETWDRVLDGAGKLVADPHDPSTIYAVLFEQGEILKSADEGATWSILASGPWAGPLWDLVVDSRTPASLYLIQSDATGAGPRTVSRSTDGGATWSPVDLGEPAAFIVSLVFSPRSPDTMYVWTQGENGTEPHSSLYLSTDAGATWQDLYYEGITDSMYAIIVPPGSEEALYVAGHGGVYRWVPEED